MHDRPDRARRKQRPHLRVQRVRDGRLLLDGAGAERGAGDRQTPEHDGQHVEPFDLRAVLHRDDHEPALGGEALQVPREIVAGDHVEHHVDPAPAGEGVDALDEVLVAVVDGRVGPEPQTGVALRLRPRRDVDGRTERPRELNRRGADAARPAVHQDRFSLGEASPVEDVGPDREERLRHRRGFGRVEAGGHGEAERRRRGAVLGVSAPGDERAHSGSDCRRVDAVTERGHGACDLQPGDVRRAGGRRVQSLALHHVGAVHARRLDCDEHLAGTGPGHLALGGNEHVGAAGFQDLDGGHAGRNRCCRHCVLSVFRWRIHRRTPADASSATPFIPSSVGRSPVRPSAPWGGLRAKVSDRPFTAGRGRRTGGSRIPACRTRAACRRAS